MSGDRLAFVQPRHRAAVPERVVHLAGSLTDSVFSRLKPATEALRRCGCEQSVLVIDNPLHPHLTEGFGPQIEVVVLPWSRSRLRRWQHWVQAARHILAQGRVDVVHVHGVLPCVLAGMVSGPELPKRFLFSPRDSQLLPSRTRWQRMAGRVARPWVRRTANAAVLTLPSDARVLNRLRSVPVAVAQAAVHAAYFRVPRRPTGHPLVVGGALDAPDAAVLRFVQVAVLMAHGENGLTFNWVGAMCERTGAALAGADIGVADSRDPQDRAARLAAAWLYLCPSASRGFPGHVVEALACGAPVVALDTTAHRDLVRDGVTGFLCADEQAMVRRTTELLADAPLRERMSSAARRDAMQRFSVADLPSVCQS